MKYRYRYFIVCFFLLGSLSLHAQNDFRTRQSGNWNDSNTWEENISGTWTNSANVPSTSSGVISILNTHTVTVASNTSADQIAIESGGGLTVNNSVNFTVAAGSGDDLTINSGATLTNNGTLTVQNVTVPPPPKVALIRVYGTVLNSGNFANASTSTLKFESGSIYNHAQDAGAIPTATWNSASTVIISGTTTAAPTSGLGQTFGNFEWNTSSLSSFIDLNGALTNISGNLSFANTNGNAVYLTSTTDYSLSVTGNLIVSGANTYLGFNSTAATTTLTVGGNFSITDAFVDYSYSGTQTFNISGNATFDGGTHNFTYGGDSNITLNVGGNLSALNSPSTNNGGTGVYTINFNGSAAQILNSTTDFVDFDYTVATNAILSIPDGSYITGSGNFTTNTSSTIELGSTNASGVLQSTTSGGSIRVPSGNRTFQSGTNIVFNGSAAQLTGDAFPSSGVNVEVNNSNGVSLSGNLTVGQTLTLTSGNLSIGAFTLTLEGDVANNGGGISGGTTSNLTINGTGTFGTLTFAGTNSLNNFTLNRTSSGNVTLGGDLNILGAFDQQAGGLTLNGNSLTLSGDFTQTGGNITGDAAASLLIEGSGALPTSMSLSGDFNTITLDRASSTLATGASFNLTNLNLLSGTLDNTGTITMANGGVVTRQQSGSLNNTLNATGTYDVLYDISSAINNGPELPTSTTTLGSLTKQGSQKLTLTQNVTINGDLTISSGSIDFGTNTVDMKGNFISNSSSLLLNSTVTFSGTTTISGTTTPIFNNITVSGTLTPTSNLKINGDFTNNGTVNASGGTTTFGGTTNLLGSQPIGLNDVTISGVVTANASQNLQIAGVLTNNGTFQSNGGTVEFNGTSSFAGTVPSFDNILISGTLTAPSSSLSVKGDFTNNGTFNANSGIVNLNGSGATQNIAGSATTDFYTLQLNNNVNVNGTANINNLLTLGSNKTLDADGSGSGVLTIVSNASGDAAIDVIPSGSSITGNITVQRYVNTIGSRAYRYIGTGLSNVTVSEWQATMPITGSFTGSSTGTVDGVTLNSNVSMYAYDETVSGVANNGYVAFPSSSNSETFNAGQGYAIFQYDRTNPATLSSRGTMTSGSFPIPLSYTSGSGAQEDGWNLVANPFAAPLDWASSGVNINASVSSQVAIRNNSSGNYIYLDHGAGSAQIIASGQAFWVHTTNSSPSLSIDQSAKSVGSGSTLYKNATTSPAQFIVSVDDGSYKDKIWIRPRVNGEAKFDKEDFYSFQNADFTLSALTSDSINTKFDYIPDWNPASMNCQQDLALSVAGLKSNQQYKLQLQNDGLDLTGLDLVLTDKYTGNATVFSGSSINYSFTTGSDPASKDKNRFYLSVSPSGSYLNTQLLASQSSYCASETTYTTGLESTQQGVQYKAYLGNKEIATFVGDGNAFQFNVADSLVQSGVNDVMFTASTTCKTDTLANKASIEIFATPTIKVSNDNQACSGNVIAVDVTGASSGATFILYGDQAKTDTLASNTTGQFTLAEKAGTYTYYAEAVNATGCNSNLQPFSFSIDSAATPLVEQVDQSLVTSMAADSYQWYKDNQAIQNATDSIYSPTSDGNYAVEVYTNNCSARSSAFNFTMKVLGIEGSLDQFIAIYPNPVRNKLRIGIDNSGVGKTFEIKLYDIKGNLYFERKFEKTSSVEIPMSNYPQGVYMLHVISNKGIATGKIVKK